jgi:DnaJ-class molecular chaperone
MKAHWLFVFTVMSIGCVASLPPDDVSVSADLAVEAARMVAVLRQTLPPTPVSDDCENCNGTGKKRSGDGIEVFTCPACNGTGKR